jgi:uncharacterized C2H2 Zn-finger protein
MPFTCEDCGVIYFGFGSYIKHRKNKHHDYANGKGRHAHSRQIQSKPVITFILTDKNGIKQMQGSDR